MIEQARLFYHAKNIYQYLAVADLTKNKTHIFAKLVHDSIDVIYSDPPWSPGNEKWWRRHAGVIAPQSYDIFLKAWCACVSLPRPQHIFCEQSVNNKHSRMLFEAIAQCSSWELPFSESWHVLYGSPKRPNVLLHWGPEPLGADPTGMRGDAMTYLVLKKICLPGSTIGDPCMGFGMTSRVAHKIGCNFVGTELSSKRLERASDWLIKKGYKTT